MIEEVAEILAEKIVSYNSLEKNKEIYAYGLQIIINTTASLGIVLLLGFILGEFLNTVVFLVCYCAIRIFAGGLHANTNNRCMIIFISGYIFICFLLKNVLFVLNGGVVCLLIAINLCVVCLAPVEAPNNPISVAKRKKMKIRSIIISFIITILVFALLFFKYEMGKWACLGLCWFTIILVTGKLKNILFLMEEPK